MQSTDIMGKSSHIAIAILENVQFDSGPKISSNSRCTRIMFADIYVSYNVINMYITITHGNTNRECLTYILKDH